MPRGQLDEPTAAVARVERIGQPHGRVLGRGPVEPGQPLAELAELGTLGVDPQTDVLALGVNPPAQVLGQGMRPPRVRTLLGAQTPERRGDRREHRGADRDHHPGGRVHRARVACRQPPAGTAARRRKTA